MNSVLNNDYREGSQFMLNRDYEPDKINLLVKYMIEDNGPGLKEILKKYSNWNFLFQCIAVEEDLFITPLFGFVSFGELELVRMLIFKERACLNQQTEPRKWTPLHLACHRGHYQIAEFLVDEGANLEMVCVDGLTPFGKLMKRLMTEITMPVGDLKPIFRLCEVMLETDIAINDVADFENMHSPLTMILINKEIMTNPAYEDKLCQTFEFFMSQGAIFSANDYEKEKIKKRLGAFTNKSLVQKLLNTDHVLDVTPPFNSMASRKTRTILEAEDKAKNTSGCFFFNICKSTN